MSSTSIFFLIRSLNVGGSERQLIYLAKGLRQRGHEVTVATYYCGVLDDELKNCGVHLINLGKRGRWDLLAFMGRLIAAVRRTRPKVLYSFLGTSNVLAGLIRPFVPRLKFVWSVRASFMDITTHDWVSNVSYRVECALSKTADLIISNSHAGAAYAVANGFPHGRMIVVANGIDTHRFKPDDVARARLRASWGVADEEILVGIVARLDPIKDHPTFIRAAALAVRTIPNLRFICIGEGSASYEAALRDLALEFGIHSKLIWAGGLKDPAGAISALDICCSASAGEGFSNSIAEAMASGVPCVVTDAGDSAIIVGSTGRTVAPGDGSAMGEAIVALSQEVGKSIGAAARGRIAQFYSLETMIESTERALIS